jgi:hypothetical protein
LEKIVEIHSVACSKQILAHGVPLVDRWTRSAVRNLDLWTINHFIYWYESYHYASNEVGGTEKNVKQCISSDHKRLKGS